MESYKISKFSTTIPGIKKSQFARKDTSERVENIIKEIKQRGCEICRGKFDCHTLNSILANFTDGIIYKNKHDEIVGFALWTKRNIKGHILTMELHLICTIENDKKLGSNMLIDIENICRREGIQQIKGVAADKNLIQFYKRFNATRNTPNNKNNLSMTRKVMPIIYNRNNSKSKNLKRKTLKRKRDNKSNKKNDYQDINIKVNNK